MGWLNDAVPHVWQWIGFFVTCLGSALALWAALSAKAATEQAKNARDQAIRLGNVLHLTDLLEDVQELQAILAREEFEGFAAKAGTIRGRIERFGRQQIEYGLSTEEVAQSLDMAKLQLLAALTTAASWKGKPENRSGRIQLAVANAYEALNKAFAIQHAFMGDTGTKP